jgi:hypothetical protein
MRRLKLKKISALLCHVELKLKETNLDLIQALSGELLKQNFPG